MIYNLARGFVAEGHKVTLCASEEFKPATMPEDEPFEIRYFPSRLRRIFKPDKLPYPCGLGKYLRAHADTIDMLLSVETFSIPSLIAALRLPGKLMIWQEMALHPRFMAKLPSKIWHNIVGRLVMRHTPLLPQSDNARKFASQYYRNILPQMLSHGANGDLFKPAAESDDYFVVMSMLVYRKRIDRIINAFADFVKQPAYAHYQLRIIGDGPEKESLEALAARLGVTDSVVFEGFKNHREFTAIGARAKAILIHTQQDNNMVTIPESIVNGTPILMNTVPTNHIFISRYDLGLVKDGWGADELEQMVANYGTYHANCLKYRDYFTTRGVAAKLTEAFRYAHNA